MRKKQKRQSHQPKAGLPWKPVPLPQEALASGGQSEADFFRGLDFDDDDYMGIKEVEGVQVVKGQDGSITLVEEGGNKKRVGKVEEKIKVQKKRKERDEVAGEDVENASGLDAESLADETASAVEVDLPDVSLSEAEAEEPSGQGDAASREKSSDADEEEIPDEEHKADFRLLMDDDADNTTSTKWSKRKFGEYQISSRKSSVLI